MAIVAVNPAGNTPNGSAHANGEEINFDAAPRHGDGIVDLFRSLPAVQDGHPAADVILSRGGTTDTGGAFGPQVSDFAHEFLGGPDTAPDIGNRVSEFAQSNPNEVPGFGTLLSEFIHGLLGGPDTTPAGGLVLSDFIHELMESPEAGVTALKGPDWLLG